MRALIVAVLVALASCGGGDSPRDAAVDMTPDTWWWPPDFIFAKHPDTGPQMDTNYTSPGFPGCCKTAVKCNVYDHDQTPQGPATCTYCGCDCGKSTICVPEK